MNKLLAVAGIVAVGCSSLLFSAKNARVDNLNDNGKDKTTSDDKLEITSLISTSTLSYAQRQAFVTADKDSDGYLTAEEIKEMSSPLLTVERAPSEEDQPVQRHEEESRVVCMLWENHQTDKPVVDPFWNDENPHTESAQVNASWDVCQTDCSDFNLFWKELATLFAQEIRPSVTCAENWNAEALSTNLPIF